MIAEFERKFRAVLEKKVIGEKKVLYTLLVRREDFIDMVKFILNMENTRLFTMVGMDERHTEEAFSVTYWFADIKAREILGIRLYVPEDEPEFPSVAGFHKGALWFEREVQDLLGLRARGIPDPRRLILPDDWPENAYPLREDFEYYLSPEGERRPSYRNPQDGSGVHSLGPYHVALDEPAHFRLFVKGEKIVDVDYRGFYSHRGIEKLARGRMNYNQVMFLAERICGICGFCHSAAYAQALEEAGKIEIPDRARYIRTILLEIERIHSQLLAVGIAAHLAGFDTGFMRTWELREKVMFLAERLTGNRKTYGMIIAGGVRRDILDYRRELIEKTIKELRKGLKELSEFLLSSGTFKKRLRGVGVLSKSTARELDVCGPVARGSGIDYDVRRDFPYAAYDELPFEVPVYSEGDALARTMVRLDEVRESIEIIDHALDSLPSGSLVAEFDEIPAGREGISAVEAPRGENVHYVMTDDRNMIFRWRIKAATYNNLQAAPDMLKGYTIADAPIIIATIDPCYSCTERVQVVDVESGKVKTISLGGGTCP
ncbi:hydrogenase large subunit [Thermococcus barophilus]|uniref:Membrane bound subgroup 4b [NiFe]-hydrogenase MBH(B)1, subunit Mbh(B)1(K+L) (Fused) (Catalytic subunit) n=1 Tax=Thermococcus barophilus TaxID=55802 RepID=A0A0S1X9Z9_THEBA|nr:NADH-quinone oxidoreductase subunit C [Thermococcus barophilus]ALM74614.1 Membrane bound subgroup 4b [NiFe]-hydrogenase MBH(b)1, subunit Mbh(b)1(K+L) (fused) (catalytic subunit) [Thermococcus barophilus]